jgi:hypothetical protein
MRVMCCFDVAGVRNNSNQQPALQLTNPAPTTDEHLQPTGPTWLISCAVASRTRNVLLDVAGVRGTSKVVRPGHHALGLAISRCGCLPILVG